MAYREHGMWEILDVLKRHHRGESQRRIAAATGRGRKTIRAYIREAKKLGWSKEVPPDEALASRVAQRRQPGPSSSEASASEKALRGHHDRIQQWVEGCEGERGLKLGDVPAAVEFGRVAAAPVNTLRQQTHRCQEISVCF